MTYTGVPRLAGVDLARPSGIDEAPERVGTTVTLAGGGIRGYTAGSRRVFTLTWNKASEATLAQLRAAAALRFTSYVHSDGDAIAVEVDPPSASAISGTEPVKFSASITIREQGVR